MGKRRVFSKISKCFILILILAAFLVAGKQEKESEEKNFFQIGKEIFKNGLIKEMLYSQSTILGLIMEQEFLVWNTTPVIKTDGFLPYEEQADFWVP